MGELRYVKFDRDLLDNYNLKLHGFNPGPYVNHGGWTVSSGSSTGWPRCIEYTAVDGWQPSVKTGFIDFFSRGPGTFFRSVNPMIVVAYTAEFQNQTGFHVDVAAWPLLTDINDDDIGWNSRAVFPVRRPGAHENQNAGLPCLSLSPFCDGYDANRRCYGAVVFTEYDGEDSYGPILKVYYVDYLNYNNLGNPLCPLNDNWFHEIDLGGMRNGIYPSIALHSCLATDLSYYSSVTYMAQTTETGTPGDPFSYHPLVMRIETDPNISSQTNPPGPPYLLTTTVTDNWYRSLHTDANYAIDGHFNWDYTFFLNPGISTVIRDLGDNNYWAAWNNRIEMQPAPQTVWGSYGSTSPL